jgi:hypothetical protein
MIGVLAVSFCERKEGEASVCLDLWAYPDGSYNLVIENFGGEGEKDLSFPCALHQLAGPLYNKVFTSQDEDGILQIERCDNSVCAEFTPFDDRDGFRHCIPFEDYQLAIEALETNAVGYLA